MTGRASTLWIALLTAASALPGCAETPLPAQPDAIVVVCPTGADRVGDRCVSTDIACPKGARWDGSRCVGLACDTASSELDGLVPSVSGEFTGDIVVNGNPTSIQTRFSSMDGSIVGDYVYGPQRAHGRLSDCRPSFQRLTCTWTEGDLSGSLRIDLAGDEQSFSGTWGLADGTSGGTWTGRRKRAGQIAAADPAPQASSPLSPLAGTYRGSIGVNRGASPIVTRFDTSTGKITGSYSYGSAQGQLSECQLSARELACTWSEGGMSGPFRVKFTPDFASFQGSWDSPQGRQGGSWSGSR